MQGGELGGEGRNILPDGGQPLPPAPQLPGLPQAVRQQGQPTHRDALMRIFKSVELIKRRLFIRIRRIVY
jgi:hypothetical protein